MFNKKIAVKRSFFKAVIVLTVLTMGIVISPTAFASACADSDNGLDIYTKGSVIDTGHPGTFNATDNCTAANTLLEYTCKNDAWYANYPNCPNGCIDGACIANTTVTWQLTKDSYYVSIPLNLNSYELGETAKVGNPVKMTPSGCVTSIYRWNSTLYEKTDYFDNWGWWPATASENFTKLEPGRGYVFITKNDSCKVEFMGSYPTQPVNVFLKKGYNIVSWHSKDPVVIAGKANVLKTTPENCILEISEKDSTAFGASKFLDHRNGAWTPLSGSESFTSLVPGKGYVFTTDKDCVFSSGEVVSTEIKKPDLIVESISIEPANPTTADNVCISATIKNIGAQDVTSSDLTAWTYVNNSHIANTFYGKVLGVGEKITKQVLCSKYGENTVFKIGENSVKVVIDPSAVNIVDELKEDNNEKNSIFNITNTASPSLTVLSPNGGEKWVRGNSYDITWSSFNISKIDIGAAAMGAKDLGMIAMGVDASKGKYIWTIPKEFGLGFNDSDAISIIVRVEDSANPNVYYDDSELFSIVNGADNSSVSATKSTITASPEVVLADGLSKSKIIVTVKSEDGTLLSGKTVTISSDRSHVGDPNENSVYTAITNLNGIAEVSVTSNIPGISIYTAIVDWNRRLGIGYKGTTLEQKAKVSFISAGDNGGNNCFPDGTLVKLPNDPKVYVIRDCKKYWIRSVEEFRRGGYKWSDVNEYSSTTVDSIPGTSDTDAIAPAVNIPEGAMIQVAGDLDVYIVKYAGNKKFKRLILNPSVFKSYGHLKWKDIIKVDKAALDSFATSTLVRSENGRIYRLNPSGDNGVRNHIKNMNVFQRLSLDMDSVYQISTTDENSYGAGQELE